MPETLAARPYSGLNISLNSIALPSAVAGLTEFFALLTACNTALKSSGLRLLLAIDEYENIDEKIELGVFKEDLLEQAMDKATVRGDTVLRQLLQGESSDAEWEYLSGFRRLDTQTIAEDEVVYRGLRRRLLVEEAGAGLRRLRVPLMQRWLRSRG